jgi:hypothetical protein
LISGLWSLTTNIQKTGQKKQQHKEVMSSAALRFVRKIRTFELKETFQRHPFVLYGVLCTVLVGWANYAQHQRLAPLYPDFETYRFKEGGRMLEAKRQEFADVLRYNQMVQTMRTDLNTRR